MVCVSQAMGEGQGVPHVSPPFHAQAAQGGNEAGSVLVLSLTDWVEGELPRSLCRMVLPWYPLYPQDPEAKAGSIHGRSVGW